jgi:hypothetical protein
MKKIIFILLISFAFSTGCENQLDLNPTNFYTDDSFWKTADHATFALNGIYQVLTSTQMYGEYVGIRFETMSPNAHNYNNELNTRDIAEGVHTGTTLGVIASRWSGCYRGIGRANNVIEKVPAINMDPELRDRYVAEAKFLRGLFYFMLSDLYGGVPLILTSPNAEAHSLLPRNTKEEVLTQVYQDLTEAAAVLPVSYEQSTDRGRATKGAALALMARVHLYNNEFDDVVSLCEQVMALNEYSLFPDYRKMFMVPNKGNSEMIFEVQFKAPEILNNFDIALAQYSTVAPVQNLIDAYEMEDGLSIQESPLYDPANPYLNRDPRFYQTIVYMGAPFRGKPANAAVLHQTGYTFKKLTMYDTEDIGTITQSEMNFPLIRYADVLLMYAEALNEVSGPVQEVHDAVNAVRNRPTVDMPDLPADLTEEEMRAAIRLERRIEFAGEGLYFFDVRRWRTIETQNVGQFRDYKGSVISTRVFDPERDYLWPIPFTEIDLNPNLEQNPEY